MKKLGKYFLSAMIVGAAFTGTQALADDPAWIRGAKILKVAVQPKGIVYITTSLAVPNLGCELYSSGLLELDTSARNFDQQYSLILAASMSGKAVDIYVNGCGSYPLAQNTVVVTD